MNICITGASRGIGLAIAKRLNTKENKLFLAATKLSSFRSKYTKDCFHCGCNLSTMQGVDLYANVIKRHTKRLDVLINNVGVFILKRFEHYTDNDIVKLVNTNLTSHVLLTKRLLPLLFSSKDPRIIFISSMAAKRTINGESLYSATKAGISNFSQVLRNEFGDNIRISTIHSWGVNTWGAKSSESLLKPDHIAQAVEFILSLKKPFLVESMDLSHQKPWRGGQAPWSPKK
jgi:NADP-dependent 3-hydroxy acid dehydrogenase YdfG